MALAHGDRSLSVSTWSALTARRAKRGPEPLVTYLDARDQQLTERTELSAISVENAVAKIANALRDEFDIGPGSRVGLHLPWHWQRSLWWGGCAAVGAEVVPYGDGDEVDLAVCTVAEVGQLRQPRCGETLVVSLHPFGLPITEALPYGFIEATAIVRAQPDGFWPDTPEETTQVSVHLPSQAEPGQRTLVACRSVDRIDSPPSWAWPLAIPLALDGSVVMVAIGEPDDGSQVQSADGPERWPKLAAIASQERADAIVVIDAED